MYPYMSDFFNLGTDFKSISSWGDTSMIDDFPINLSKSLKFSLEVSMTFDLGLTF